MVTYCMEDFLRFKLLVGRRGTLRIRVTFAVFALRHATRVSWIWDRIQKRVMGNGFTFTRFRLCCRRVCMTPTDILNFNFLLVVGGYEWFWLVRIVFVWLGWLEMVLESL